MMFGALICCCNWFLKFLTAYILTSICVSVENYRTLKGPSGSGKTTLLNVLGNLIFPDTGKIYFNGETVAQKPVHNYRKKISYLFQSPIFFENYSIEENIKMVCDLNEVNLNQVEIRALAKKLKINDFLDARLNVLSGGQRLRVAVLLLFCKDSDIILADEPLAFVDFDNRETILDILNNAKANGKTVIIVSHDDRLKNWVDEVVELKI